MRDSCGSRGCCPPPAARESARDRRLAWVALCITAALFGVFGSRSAWPDPAEAVGMAAPASTAARALVAPDRAALQPVPVRA